MREDSIEHNKQSPLSEDNGDCNILNENESVHEVLEDLKQLVPEEKQRSPEFAHLIQALRVSRTSIQSPYLPPEYIEAYNRASPGLGDKIIESMFNQHTHAMQMNERQMTRLEKADDFEREEFRHHRIERDKEITIKKRGQIFAFILCLALFGIAMYSAIIGAFGVAYAAFGALSVVIGGFFLQNTFLGIKQNKEKMSEEMPDLIGKKEDNEL